MSSSPMSMTSSWQQLAAQVAQEMVALLIGDGAGLITKATQSFEVEDIDATIFAAHQPGIFQHLERLIGALPGNAGQVTQLFLRNLQQAIGAGVEHWVEQGGKAAGDACIDIKHALVFYHADELAEALIQLRNQVTVESHRKVLRFMKATRVSRIAMTS